MDDLSGKRQRGKGKENRICESNDAIGCDNLENMQDEAIDNNVGKKSKKPNKVKHNLTRLGDVEDTFDASNTVDNETFEENTVPYEAGQILTVFMENFMCHRKHTVTLGRHLNFITGRNGSGKSAIVVAIQLCLGATARTTGRGNNLSQLIREGSDGPAIIRVTLLNEGLDAYLPDKYGNRIIVERKIPRNGGASYILYNYKQQEISREKKELEMILNSFNIFVDNPCCVLTQEESKRFIQGKEKDRYDFFLKATGLQRIFETMQSINEDLETTTSTQQKLEKQIQTKTDTYTKLKEIHKQLQALDGIEDKLREGHAKIKWYHVYFVQNVMKELQEKLDHELLHEENVQLKLNELLATNTDQSDETSKLGELIKDIQVEQQGIMGSLSTVQQRVSQQSKDVNLQKSNMSTLNKKKEEFNSRFIAVQQDLTNIRTKAMKDAQQDVKVVLEKIETCCREIAELELEDQRIKQSRSELIIKNEDLQRSIREVTNIRNEARKEIEEQKRKLDAIVHASSGNGRDVLFGESIQNVLRFMSQTRFKDKVYGPLGKYLVVKDGLNRSIGFALERALGGFLSSFMVSNSEDERQLKNIFKQVGCLAKHTIFITHKRPRYDVELLYPSTPDGMIVMDAMIIEDDLVFNCAIDQASIQSTVIVANEQSCMRHFVERDPYHNMERLRYNLKSAITHSGTMIQYRRGNVSSEVARSQYRRMLSEETAEVVAEIKSIIEAKEYDYHHYNETLTEFNTSLQVVIRSSAQLKHDLDKVMQSLRMKCKQRQELESRLAEVQEAGHVDTSGMEEEMIELRESIETCDRQISLIQTEWEGLQNVLIISQNEKKELEKQRALIMEKLSKHQKTLEEFVELRQDNKRQVERMERSKMEISSLIKELKLKVEGQQNDYEVKLKEAMEVTKDVVQDWNGEPLKLEAKETDVTIARKMRQLTDQLARGKEQAGITGYTMDIIMSKLTKAKDDLKSSKEEYVSLVQRIENLKQDFEDRAKLWAKLRNQNSKKVKKYFDDYLQKKKFAGTVRFDHNERTLHMIVQTDNTNENTKSNDVRNLSGGERSFVTFSLLLALGHVIECPFRLKDEYDVFLDEVSRRLTLDLLIDYSKKKEQRGRQFIILTPHSLKDVITSNEVRIIQMGDPKTNRAHGLQQTTLDN